MLSFFNRVSPYLAVLIVLCAIAGLAYGPLIAIAGVFGDDPNVLYAYHRLGTDGFDAFYGWARPFSTWVHKFVIPLTGIHLARINMATIILRVVSCWMLFVLIRELTKGKEGLAWMAAVIALIYPGFTQQAQAVQFLLHFSVLTLALFSLWAMVKGARAEKQIWRIFWMAASIASACAQVSIEYFFGLELLHPIVLWMAMRGKKNEKFHFRKFMCFYGPFLGLLGLYLAWRVVIFQPPYPHITILDAVRDAPIAAIGEIIRRIGADLTRVLGGVWFEMMRAFFAQPITPMMKLCAVAAGGLTIVVPLFIDREKAAGTQEIQHILLIGLCALLLGGVPLWASNTPLTVTHPWNRTMLCYLVGVSMMFAGVVSLLPRRLMQAFVFLIIGMATIFQQQIAADYAREWGEVKNLFMQLTEQVPQLKEGTLVLYDDFPFRYYSANNLNAFLNWTYDPERGQGDEKFKMFEIDERLGGTLPSLKAGMPIIHNTFKGSTAQTLVIAIDAEGDLVILDKNKIFEGSLPGRTQEAIYLSDPDRVILFDNGQAQVPSVLD